jgi:hypothetical protein
VGLSEERLAKLAHGRAQGLIVDAYLKELRVNPPKRGRARTAKSAQREKEDIEKRIASGRLTLSGELQARQKVRDLDREIGQLQARTGRMQRLESDFIAICAEYSQHRNLTKEAWAEMGVPVRVLRQCGLGRRKRNP